MSMEGNIAALGTREFTGVFAALGVDAFVVDGAEQAQVEKRFAEIIEGGYTLVLVAEEVAESAGETFTAREQAVTPVVLVVPFMAESSGYALRHLGLAVKHATGVDIVQ